MEVSEIVCRKAEESDIDALAAMIGSYAEQGIMLPRSREALLRHKDQFIVAEADGELVGCGSLFQLGGDLVEIRSLGVSAEHQGKGIGSKLVGLLEQEARERRIPKIMALTYQVAFFERNGYSVVAKDIFPEKVWTDCIHCKKQHCCDEIAVLKRLE